MQENEKILVLEVNDASVCETEPNEWIKIGSPPDKEKRGEEYWKQYFDKSLQDYISDILSNAEYDVPITFTLKVVSKEQWREAEKYGDESA